MANTLTLSVSEEHKHYLKENQIKKSELFHDAIRLHRKMKEFLDVQRVFDYYGKIKELHEKIIFFQKEIVRRNETIEALQDVLAQKEINERKV